MKNFDLAVGDFVSLTEVLSSGEDFKIFWPYIVVCLNDDGVGVGVCEVPERFLNLDNRSSPKSGPTEILDWIMSNSIPKGGFEELVREECDWRFKTDPCIGEVWVKGYCYSKGE